MSIWIARDKNGSLWVYEAKPWRGPDGKFKLEQHNSEYMKVNDSNQYPEVTWENSPKELVVKGEE